MSKEVLNSSHGDVKMNVHFKSTSDNWKTPDNVFQSLNDEFNFNFDPCPLNEKPAPFPSCVVVFKNTGTIKETECPECGSRFTEGR